MNKMPITVSALGFSYGAAGKRRKAQQVWMQLQELARKQYVSPYDFVLIHTGLEQFDAAFESLEVMTTVSFVLTRFQFASTA